MKTESMISDFLTKKTDLTAIYIFGSYLSNSFNSESDIDISILGKKAAGPDMLYELSSGLSTVINRDIHPVDFETASAVLKMQILKNKKVIYCSNDEERLFAEMKALSEYEKLNEERAPFLKEKPGKRYGHYLNKTESVKRCIQRINDEYAGNEENLQNFTKQDSIILNLQRACEQSIDLANYIISKYSLGIPQNSRDAFDILKNNLLIDGAICSKMKKMIGFGNIAVHEYQELNRNILLSIIKKNLTDFNDYIQQLLINIKKRNTHITGEVS